MCEGVRGVVRRWRRGESPFKVFEWVPWRADCTVVAVTPRPPRANEEILTRATRVLGVLDARCTMGKAVECDREATRVATGMELLGGGSGAWDGGAVSMNMEASGREGREALLVALWEGVCGCLVPGARCSGDDGTWEAEGVVG